MSSFEDDMVSCEFCRNGGGRPNRTVYFGGRAYGACPDCAARFVPAAFEGPQKPQPRKILVATCSLCKGPWVEGHDCRC